MTLLRPARSAATVAIGAARDLTRTRSELPGENAVLRQQLIVLRHGIRRPRIHRDDRLLLLVLVRLCRRWRGALQVVKPETLLRWHRNPFKLVWRRRSRPKGQALRLAPEVVTRFLGSVRRECLEHVVILNERQPRRVLKEYVEVYFNRARPRLQTTHCGRSSRDPQGPL